MKPFAILAGGALLAASVTASAVGQTTSPLAYVQPVPPPAVQGVQEHLRSAGAYNGAADGVWGPDSVAALQRFQASHQLQVTGVRPGLPWQVSWVSTAPASLPLASPPRSCW